MELTREAKNLKNEYMRDYRLQHLENQRAYYKKYNEDHKEEKRESNLKYWNRKAAAL